MSRIKTPPRRSLHRLALGWMLLLLLVVGVASFPHISAADTPTSTPASKGELAQIYLPFLRRQVAATPTATPTATATTALPTATSTPIARQWDSRLDQRHTTLIEATVQPQQGYWRLVRAQWYNEAEAGGRHHILVDVLDSEGARLVDVPIRIHWNGGESILHTQAKAGEPYAGDFAMFSIAPSYGAYPITGASADAVWGMGLGSIELPFHTVHTSYGLVWQWTVPDGEPPTATHTPTATPTPTNTVTATSTPTQTAAFTPTPSPETNETATATATATVTATATATVTVTATVTPSLPAREWDPRLDQRGVELIEAQVAPGQGYWRLVRGIWYDAAESGGRHHIFVDLLDAEGQRLTERPMRIYWNGGEFIMHTQAKPGEPYAADFGMSSVAPSYGAMPADGAPADSLWGMGLGSIEQPNYAIQTSYGFVWQWTVYEAPARSNAGKEQGVIQVGGRPSAGDFSQQRDGGFALVATSLVKSPALSPQE